MRVSIFAFVAAIGLLLATGCASSGGNTTTIFAEKKSTVYVVGTRTEGSSVTEPLPQKGKILETMHAGFVVIEKGVAYYLQARVLKPENYFVRVEYENPVDKGRPFVNEMELGPNDKEALFSSSDVVSGIRNYGDYKIRVSVFANRESREPIETLTQTVRSYVDTTGSDVRVLKGVQPK